MTPENPAPLPCGRPARRCGGPDSRLSSCLLPPAAILPVFSADRDMPVSQKYGRKATLARPREPRWRRSIVPAAWR
jgi:hypothetical protein